MIHTVLLGCIKEPSTYTNWSDALWNVWSFVAFLTFAIVVSLPIIHNTNKKDQKLIFFRFLLVTTGSDDGRFLDRGAPEKRNVYHPWNFKGLSYVIFEKSCGQNCFLKSFKDDNFRLEVNEDVKNPFCVDFDNSEVVFLHVDFFIKN